MHPPISIEQSSSRCAGDRRRIICAALALWTCAAGIAAAQQSADPVAAYQGKYADDARFTKAFAGFAGLCTDSERTARMISPAH